LTMKDFTRQAKVVEFKIDDDTFRGKPHLPAQTMIDFTVAVESLDDENTTSEQGFQTMMDSLKMVLMPESYKRFKDRMRDPDSETETAETVLSRVRQWLEGTNGAVDAADVLRSLTPQTLSPDAASSAPYVPIELEQLPEILEWVMGEYGMRPTQSSADSSNGQSSPASGTNSTDSTSDVESISATSPSTDS